MPLIRKRRSKSSIGALVATSAIFKDAGSFITRVEADGGYVEAAACLGLAILSLPPAATP